jgi:hypothetical protein
MAASTFVLAILTIVAVALACSLAAYIMADRVPRELAIAGFLPWAGPSTFPMLSDFMSLNDNRAWPIEGIWVDFIPGQKLAFAFVDEASVWAWSAGASSLTAGLLALTASMKWQALNYQTKQAFCALTFLSAGICIVALVLAGGEQPVYGFTIDG